MRGVNVRRGIRQQDMGVFALSLPAAILSAVAVMETADPTWQIPCLVAIGVIHLSLIVRHRLPWVTLFLTGLGALTLLGGPAIPASVTDLPGPLPSILLPSTAMFGIAIYSVAAHARSNRWLAVVLGVAGAVEVAASLWNGIPWLLQPTIPEAWRLGVALVGVLVVMLAFAAGRWRALEARTSRPDPRLVAAGPDPDPFHIDDAITRQHTRVAREVQRAVVANLDEILSRAREGRVASRRAPALADDALADITQQGEEALGRVHSLLSLLEETDPVIDDEAEDAAPVLAAEHALAPQPQLGDLPKLIDAARGEGLSVTLAVEGERGDLPVAAQLALYRTAQEALTNTVRHAGPGAVAQVELLWEPAEVSVTIEDELPGGGPDELMDDLTDPRDYVEGRGLRVVRERLETAGGYLEVDQLDGGYRVRGVVPRAVQDSV